MPYRLYQLSLDTQDVQVLTNPPNGIWGDIIPRASRDNEKIAFLRARSSYSEICMCSIMASKSQSGSHLTIEKLLG